MARVSKTSPFRPRVEPVAPPNTESEKIDEEKSNSSSNTDRNTQDKKEEKAKGKKPRQAKNRTRKTPIYDIINGPFRPKGTVTKRGMGKPMAYTTRLWNKHHPIHISSDDEPDNVDPKSKGSQDKKKEKTKGKRPMQAKGNANKRGRGKPWSKRNPISPLKKSNTNFLKVKEDDDVFPSSETDSDEVCKRINIKRHNNDDTDNDNNGQGSKTYGNLISFSIQVVDK